MRRLVKLAVVIAFLALPLVSGKQAIRTPVEKSADDEEGKTAIHREGWARFTLGDENGFIPADGLPRAIAQRDAIIFRSRTQASTNAVGLPTSASGWTNLTGYIHPVGRVNDLVIDPSSMDRMWAATDGGGIWKTIDGGNSWQVVNDFLSSLSFGSLATSAGNTHTIYAATGPYFHSHTNLPGVGIYKSVDSGATWALLSAVSPSVNPDFIYIAQLCVDPADSNTVIAATYGGAYITTDGGSKWTRITSTRADNVAIHPSNSLLRVIAMDDGTVNIASDGATYNTYKIASVSGSSYTRIALAPSDPDVMYALIYDSDATTLYRSSTRGISWSAVATPKQVLFGVLSYTGGLWVDPTNANHVGIAELGMAVTRDASVASPTWAVATSTWVDFHGMVSEPAYDGTVKKGLYAFNDGGLYKWSDVDTINTALPSYLSTNGIVNTEVNSVAGRGGTIICGAQDVASRYYKSTSFDPTPRWRFASMGGYDGGTTAADPTNPSILYGSTQFLGIHRSTDGGSTSTFICQGITDIGCGAYKGNAAFVAPFVLDPNNPNRMLAGAASLWRSNDVSTGSPPSWSQIHSGVGSNVTAISVGPSNSDVIWVAYENGNVYKTLNGTVMNPRWEQVTTVPSGNKLRIHIDRTNAQRVFIGLSGFLADRLVVTTDGGTTWNSVKGLPSASVFAIEQHPTNASWLYVGTAVGLFASSDDGSTWSAANVGPASVQVRDLSWYSDSPPVLLIATFGRGVWKAALISATPSGRRRLAR